MKTTIYFVRHAHSDYTPDELNRPLSIRGQADAALVTEILKDKKIDLIVSSPYKRAIQTVEGIADHFNVEIPLIEDLKERTLASHAVDNFEQAITKVWEDFTFSWEGGESSFQAQERGVHALNMLIEEHRGKSIVIGSHGNIMVLIMNYFDSQYDFDFWKRLTMPDIYRLVFDGDTLIDVERLWTKS